MSSISTHSRVFMLYFCHSVVTECSLRMSISISRRYRKMAVMCVRTKAMEDLVLPDYLPSEKPSSKICRVVETGRIDHQAVCVLVRWEEEK